MPLLPLRMLSQAVAMSLPTGEMMPMPVTTTRRLLMDFNPYVFSGLAAAQRLASSHHTVSDVSKGRNENCAKVAQLSVSPRERNPRRHGRRHRSRNRSVLGVGLDVVHGLLNGGDLLGLFVRDLGLELFLESHHQLHRVQRI